MPKVVCKQANTKTQGLLLVEFFVASGIEDWTRKFDKSTCTRYIIVGVSLVAYVIRTSS